MQLTTTLNRIKAHSPCSNGWKKLLKNLGKTTADDEPLPFSVILDSNGLEDALWCCRTALEYDRVWRLYAVWCTRQVQRLMIDPRSLNVLDVAERYANGQATDEELSAAWIAAKDAEVATFDAGASQAAQSAARAAARTAWTGARGAGIAAFDAEVAAFDAGDTRAAGDARETARAAQTAKFREMISGN